MSVLQFCCLPPCGLYNPWTLGVSGDGYKCDQPVSPGPSILAIGTDFGLTTYASFTDGTPNQNPCQYSGISPWNRALADIDPTQVNYSSTCDAFPSAVNYCCCSTNNDCVPSQGGDQCEWFANDENFPGSYFTEFNLLCLKTGVDVASQTVEETEYTDCCTTFFTEANCGEVACSCELLYGNTTCNRSKTAYSFGDICDNTGSCPDNAGYAYISGEPVLTTYYGFDAAVTAEVIDANDPLGVYEKALIFESLTGDTFTARMLLYDHLVDIVNDIIDYPGILSGYAASLGVPPDDDVTTAWGNFPNGPYSPLNAGGGYEPWVTITLTMTSGTYNGNTYTYHGYGTAQQFQVWAQTNWPPVANNVVLIVGSPNYWLGLRISSHALDTATGQYTPFHEYRRLVTRQITLGYMPDNSDDFLLDSTTDTQVIWTARLRQFYTWETYTTMTDIRAHGMSLDNIVSNGGCCNFEHCTRTRSWYGVTGSDPLVAPCTVTNPLIDASGSCGIYGTTHTDFCFPSKCAVSEQAVFYQGYVTGTTRSTCFPSQYNKPMDYDFVQDINDFSSLNSACIILP